MLSEVWEAHLITPGVNSMSLKPCSHCSRQIPTDVNFCPYCTRPTRSRLLIWLRANILGITLGVVAAVVLAGVMNKPSTSPTPAPTDLPTIILEIMTDTPVPTNTPTITSIPTAIGRRIASKDHMMLVYVPSGEFNMGLDDGWDNEMPMHTVYLDGYWIDQTEVTNAQYALCVAAGSCSEPLDLNSQISDRFKDSKYENHPVVFVDWNQSKAYCSWAGRRLPTEAEWEKAARGTDERIYPWGNTFTSMRANFCDVNCWGDWKDTSHDDGYDTTSPVGTYSSGASPYGALDMAGNAYEWVSDWSSPYTIEPQNNPTGPASGKEHSLRGGSWGDDINHIRTVIRTDEPADLRRDFIGFRCAR
jgi:eukaryotic-like serine/threonine-protein kinase